MNFKVLYVDDDDVPRYIFEKSFASKYSILTAESGQEALNIISELNDEFIVVISDMIMPRMNGIELITEIQKRSQNTACFILTALTRRYDEIEQAIDDCLIKKVFRKPLNVLEIQSAIEEVTSIDA